MKITIAGAGAMGCLFGWMLQDGGHEVALLDSWAAHVEAIQAHGLTVETGSGVRTVDLPIRLLANAKPSPAGTPDLLIVFGKSMQTEAIMRQTVPLLGPDTQVMTMQNGIGNVEVLGRHVPEDRLVAGVTTFSAELVGPGRVRALGSGNTKIMAFGAGRAEVIAEAMNSGGLNVRVSDDVTGMIWTKLAFNAVLNALCTIASVPVGALPAFPGLADVIRSIVDEVVAVAAAESVELDTDDIVDAIGEQFAPAVAGEHLPSMLQDVLAQRPTEIDYLNGAVVERASARGIAAPWNTVITALVKLIEATHDGRV